jgi:hypothetical protein
MAQVQQSGVPINLTSTGAISLVPGSLIGYHVNSTTGGTMVFRNGGASGSAVSGTITPTVGFQAFPAYFSTSAHVTIANTLDVTFFWTAG